MQRILPVTLVLAAFCLALGLVLPLMRFEKLYLFDSAPSLIGIIHSLWSDGEWALSAIIFLVSVLFPLLKLCAIAAQALAPLQPSAAPRKLSSARFLPHLSRWSLMDVMIVAIVIVAAKTGGLAQATSQPGLWFYALSALLAVLSHAMVIRMRTAIGAPLHPIKDDA
ncbi:paraquat-inducible protein A [Pseudohoeflea coraliihabitans]|uniref:Paraquat-inducible protein A n=1 Tax=Pseudohoeflea coraliihabitans TaxID=2860393 RepID=A0ABS6WK82_9HYPH|nr:paraquat-inducible protein A [Pseudohoeflea sp. DP4N28-3]MBW3096280.1 paraquat-inducible protein A [Pseudohoeflea sp. DP4N28-3]